jgi:hypothetical protein
LIRIPVTDLVTGIRKKLCDQADTDGVIVTEAPDPLTVISPPTKAAEPINVPAVEADQMPASLYVPAATGIVTAPPVRTQ